MATNPTDNGKGDTQGYAVPPGEKISPDTGQEGSESQNAKREPLPIEFMEFTASIREVFREIKKLITFIRNQKNANAALVFLTLLLAIAAFTQAVIYGIQLAPIRRSAEAAQKSAETASKQLEMADRPWIKDGN